MSVQLHSFRSAVSARCCAHENTMLNTPLPAAWSATSRRHMPPKTISRRGALHCVLGHIDRTNAVASCRVFAKKETRLISELANASLRVIRFDRLGEGELQEWSELRNGNPLLDSPFFHPGFADAVHTSGKDVFVVVAKDHYGKIETILPCHTEGSRIRPVGWPGADFQGPILAAGTRFNPSRILAGPIRRYSFDHLVESCPDFSPWIDTHRPSPFLDVTGSLSGYLGRASRSGKENMGQARRRSNKATREIGPIRVTLSSTDPNLLGEVIRLKRSQHAATGTKDYFADSSRLALLSTLLQRRNSEFGGLLTTVHAGPHLLAAHFGMRAGKVLHWWFPVYDPAFARFVPGWILLRELVSAAGELGITRIDLGRGDDEYKRRAKTGETQVAQGEVGRGTTSRLVHRAKVEVVESIKSSSMAPVLRRTVRKARSLR